MLKKGKSKKSSSDGNMYQKSRKDSRKEQRKIKKQTKQKSFQQYIKSKKNSGKNSTDKHSDTSSSDKPGKFVLLNKLVKASNEIKKSKSVKGGESLGDKMNAEFIAEKRRLRAVEKSMKKQRNQQLAEANEKEERTIKMLEKQLKLDKRKNRSVPRSFVDSGLDYILDVCDSSKVQAAVQAEMNLQESGSEFEEDLAMVTGKSEDKKKRKKALKSKVKINKTNYESKSDSDEYPDDIFDEDSSSGMEGLEGLDDDHFSDGAPEEVPSKRGSNVKRGDSKQIADAKSKNTLFKKPTYASDEEEDDISDDDLSDFDETDDSSGEEEISSVISPPEPKAGSSAKRKHHDERGSSKASKQMKLSDESSENSFDDEIDDDVMGADGSKGTDEEEYSKNNDDITVHEDIYGRLRDKKGNVIQPNTMKYVPPHLRNQPVDDKKKAELEKLGKTLKGLLNRLAENNMHNISNQIDDLYMKHSRYDMNNTLLKQYLDSLITPVHTPERLIMEHAMLIAVLHANVGSEVGAFFLQHLGKKFDEMHAQLAEIENKELDNLILFLCHMYTFKIFDSVLLYDILQELTNQFSPKDVDLILVVLRTVGFNLRKDNPLSLKDFILKVQKLANEAGEMKDDSRVRFMLDILLSVKNNNVSKIPQYDTTHSEHLKKIIKPMFRKGNYVTELKITLEELLKADERGKWWVVGSAWTGPAPQAEKAKANTEVAGSNSFTQEILDLAKKQRMNTVNRKNIFCILMSAEDYLDAFEKLLKLGLKGQPEQDIVHVLIHCLLSETNYNPYYSHIADQLCMSDRRHRMTIQYSVWDRFKELKTHSNHQVTNLAKFLAHLFIQNSLPLSTLKVLEFTEMDKPCVRLLRQILLSLLLHEDKEAMVAVFSRVSKPSKLLVFRESIRLFMHHFLLKNIKDDEGAPEGEKLKDAIALAEQALMAFSDAR